MRVTPPLQHAHVFQTLDRNNLLPWASQHGSSTLYNFQGHYDTHLKLPGQSHFEQLSLCHFCSAAGAHTDHNVVLGAFIEPEVGKRLQQQGTSSGQLQILDLGAAISEGWRLPT